MFADCRRQKPRLVCWGESGVRQGFLLTPHRHDGISPLDCVPVNSLSGEHGGGVPALNARILGPKVEDHIQVSIPVDILQGRLHRSSLRAGSPEEDWLRAEEEIRRQAATG